MKTSEKLESLLPEIHKHMIGHKTFMSTFCEAIEEVKEIQRWAHLGLPDECVSGWDEVKFCPNRQGDGGLCKHCSNYD